MCAYAVKVLVVVRSPSPCPVRVRRGQSVTHLKEDGARDAGKLGKLVDADRVVGKVYVHETH